MKKLETTLLIAAVCIMAVFSMFFRLMFAKDSSNDNKSQKTLLVHAASSLTEAFQEVGTEFEKDTGVKVDFNFAGSQALYNMIKQGEKGDIFASASLKYMEDLEKDGLAEPYSVFAENKIVICRSNGYKGDITSLKDLGKTGLRLVLADKSVPVGSYFYTALDNACKSGSVSAEDKDKILKNVVSSEVNVKDVLGKVLLGEADCGVVYNTDLSAAMSDKAEAVRLKELDSVTAEYPAAVIKSTRNKTEAELFIKFITTGKGRDILIKYGFDAG